MKRHLPGLCALLAGLAAALAHPPFGLIVGIVAYGAMMRLAEAAPTLNSAFWRGWLMGLAYFGLSCWWIAEAFLVDVETFGWMAPFAVALLAGGLGLFWGVVMALWRALKLEGAWRIIAFAGVFSAMEWVRGHIFTGFPWNLPGTSWAAGGLVSQTAHYLGAYGLTWLTLLIGAAPWVLLDPKEHRRQQLVMVSLCGLGLAAMVALGMRSTGQHPSGEPLHVRVVQANIPQAARYDAALYLDMVRQYLTLSTLPPQPINDFQLEASPKPMGTGLDSDKLSQAMNMAGARAPDLIVWPEGALPTSLNEYLAPGDPVREAIKTALQPGQTLITGGYRQQGQTLFNSMAVVHRTETDLVVEAIYDKHHLVPFGEYVPGFLAAVGLQQLVPLAPFTPGPRPEPINTRLGRIQPLICYEALFPGYVLDGARLSGQPADMIVNISNDSWFGATSGPWQHHNQARYRAIEEGLPMVRATPTGVSSVIDKYGRIRNKGTLGHGQSGVVDALVYFDKRKDVATVNNVPRMTPYTWLRRWGFLFLLGVSCLSSIAYYSFIQKKYVT